MDPQLAGFVGTPTKRAPNLWNHPFKKLLLSFGLSTPCLGAWSLVWFRFLTDPPVDLYKGPYGLY